MMIVEAQLLADRQARYDRELAELDDRGLKIAGLLFAAYHDSEDASEHSPVTISQATKLLNDPEYRAEFIGLLVNA